jgi:hypothetical protein
VIHNDTRSTKYQISLMLIRHLTAWSLFKKNLSHLPGIESNCSVSFVRRIHRTKFPRADTKNRSSVGRVKPRRHESRMKLSLKEWLMVKKSNTGLPVLQIYKFFSVYFSFFMAYVYRKGNKFPQLSATTESAYSASTKEYRLIYVLRRHICIYWRR